MSHIYIMQTQSHSYIISYFVKGIWSNKYFLSSKFFLSSDTGLFSEQLWSRNAILMSGQSLEIVWNVIYIKGWEPWVCNNFQEMKYVDDDCNIKWLFHRDSMAYNNWILRHMSVWDDKKRKFIKLGYSYMIIYIKIKFPVREEKAQANNSCICEISHQCPYLRIFDSFLRYYIEKEVMGTRWLPVEKYKVLYVISIPWG